MSSQEDGLVPGAVIVANSPLVPVGGELRRAALSVVNTSCWPVSVTSHFHFFEVNRRLRFDRARAFGMHLDVIAGGSVRWLPGELRAVELVEYRGDRGVYGFNGFVNATLGDPETFDALREAALRRIREAGFEDGDPSDEQWAAARNQF